MSKYPGDYPPPPPYYGPPYWPPPPHAYPPYPAHPYPPNPAPPPPGPIYPPPPDGGQVTAQPYPFVPMLAGAMMVPVPFAPAVQPEPNQPTYITNYIYHEGSNNPAPAPANPAIEDSKLVELSGEYDWVPTTATTAANLSGQAVVGGHEGWDGSPLWVIRAWHNGELIPGKFSIRHNSASIVYDRKEISVQNIEVLIAKPENLRWIPASNGNVPPGAIPGGRVAGGEVLYVGRARHQLSITPGKIHPSHNSCYISFAGTEVAHKMYDVLCRIS